MKNVLVYINPDKHFDSEKDILVKVQIDNSIDLGWDIGDILLVTNFPYEYRGVQSMIVDDNNYCEFRPLSTKTITVANLLNQGLVNDADIYWVHDFDAYQLNAMDAPDILDAGFTDYGWSRKWCLGSYFIRSSAKDMFQLLKNTIYQDRLEDERALVKLTRNNTGGINTRYNKLNITYNFGMRHTDISYEKADKPLKVLHFHPWYRGGIDTLGIFMYGKNNMNTPLMSDRLMKIFHKYGIQ